MIKIYTYSHNRPDLIKPQYESFKRHIKDDFEFIVFNNERAGSNPFSGYSPDRVQEIFDVCNEIGIECIRVDLDPQYQFINGYKQFEGDSFTGDGSQVCGYAFTWGWQHYISKNDCVSLIIDSDMFFIKDISIEEMIKGYNLSIIPSYRYSRKYSDGDPGEIALKYPWNGIVIADVPNLPNPSELKWDLGIFNGQSCDVGGGGHKYLSDYENELKIKYMDQVSVQRDADSGDKHTPPAGYIEMGFNGCSPMHVNLIEKEFHILDYQHSDTQTFPHQKERENYWQYVYDCFTYMVDYASKYQFPKPTFIDLIKFEEDDSMEDAFVLHYKNASNGNAWQSDDYNALKTRSLNKVLGGN
jgi:hypothetical protein